MSLAEVFKRFGENFGIILSRIKYHNPSQWPYSRFARDDILLKINSLPAFPVENNWECYLIYNKEFDLTTLLDWYFSENNNSVWPSCHYSLQWKI